MFLSYVHGSKTVCIKLGNLFSKTRCSKVNWFEFAKQCNCIAAEIVTSHASWSFLFWKFEQQGACNFSFWSGGLFAHIWHDLLDVWVIIWLWWDRTCRTCSIAVSFVLKSEVDMLKMWMHKRSRAENNPTNHYPKQILITCSDHPNY